MAETYRGNDLITLWYEHKNNLWLNIGEPDSRYIKITEVGVPIFADGSLRVYAEGLIFPLAVPVNAPIEIGIGIGNKEQNNG